MLFGILVGFLGSCFGWQINLIAIQRGIRRGKIAAFLVGCGAITADMLFLAIGFAGTQPILDHPEWWGLIRWIGISVILVLAARVFFIHAKNCPEAHEVQERPSPRNFLVGFLVVMTNPVIFLMWVWVIGFLQAHFQEAREPWFREFFLTGFLVGSVLWFFPLAFVLLEKLNRWTRTNHASISYISGGVLVAIALFLIFFEKF